MVFLIIEGPTCSGKTTFHRHVSDRLVGRPVTHHMQRPEELTREWVAQEYVSRWELFDWSDDLVWDRAHWGEATYAPIYRAETNNDGFGLLGKAGWRWTEMFLASRGASIALLTADNETLAARLESRGDDHVKNLDELFRVASLYNHARRESTNVSAAFDTSGEIDDEAYAAFVDSYLEDAQSRSERAELVTGRFPKYTGSLTPGFILVGNQRTTASRWATTINTNLPFAPGEGTASEFLLESLPDLAWRTAGMVNANEDTDIAGLLTALEFPRMIALGADAADALTQQGYSSEHFATLPDPQDVMDQERSQKEYGQAIVEAADKGEAPESWTL